jgi:putative ABC transport system substrate-binding protein
VVQIQVVNASTIGEINAAFAALARDRAETLFVAGDAFFTSRRVQLATLAARDRIPAVYVRRDFPAAGALMSYGADGKMSRARSTSIPATSSRAPRPRSCPSSGPQIQSRYQHRNRDAAPHRGAAATPWHRRRADRIGHEGQ